GGAGLGGHGGGELADAFDVGGVERAGPPGVVAGGGHGGADAAPGDELERDQRGGAPEAGRRVGRGVGAGPGQGGDGAGHGQPGGGGLSQADVPVVLLGDGEGALARRVEEGHGPRPGRVAGLEDGRVLSQGHGRTVY